MIGRAEAGDERQPQRHRVAEGVKERQDAEHDIAVAEAEQRVGAVDVGEDVAMRQHHAFRHAGAAAGKNYCRERLGVVWRQKEPRDQRGWKDARRDQHRQPRQRAGLLEHLFEEQHARTGSEIGLGEKDARGQRHRDAAAFDGSGHRVAAGREVQVHRHAAGHRSRDVRKRSADRRREQQTNRFTVAGVTADRASQQEATDQRASEGQLTAGGVGHAERRPARFGGAHESRGERVTHARDFTEF